ncbi:MAG TPA: hypothetical protein VIX42_12450 [Edaphobacter sp.]
MASSKSLSIHDLAGAVHKAVSAANLKVPPAAGPYAYIHPPIICGIIYFESIEQKGAQEVAATIAKHASEQLGATVAPVVQQGAAQGAKEGGGAAALLPNHVILGYKPGPEFNVRF